MSKLGMSLSEEAARCLLCHEAKCTSACNNGYDPAKFIQAIRFENTFVAAKYIDREKCMACDGACEAECIHYDKTLRIREMVDKISEAINVHEIDLSINFCGIRCENPFFLSSSVVASGYDMCATALKMGWAGVVYKTIGFITPKEVSPRFSAVRKEGTPFVGFRNMEQISEHPLMEELAVLKKLKEDFPQKIIVASIMGQNEDEWTKLAKMCTDSGVDIIECNFSCPHMTGEGLGSDVGSNPEVVKLYTQATRRGTNKPVIAKMTPNVTNMEVPALAALESGADGIAAINTIKSISSIELDKMAPLPSVMGKSTVSGYSGKAIKPIALRFIHDMAANEDIGKAPISGMGGIESWKDACEFLALGCTNLQVTTSIMQYGYRIIDDLIDGLKGFMISKGYSHVSDFVGSALPNVINADYLDRKTVVFPKIDTEKCIGCGRCFLSCRDGGHQAISFDEHKPKILGNKCVGCHLCLLVCPVEAIGKSKRINKL